MRLAHLGLALLLVVQTGCYWKYENVAGDSMPVRQKIEPTYVSAGVQVNPDSWEPPAAWASKADVAEMFAQRLAKDRVFDPVIFPYSTLAQADPAVVLDATISIEQDEHMGANMVKAIFTGLTFFLLGPVLPTRFTAVVDLTVDATSRHGEAIGTYAYRSEYDYRYTSMTPSRKEMDRWLEATKRHAVEEVVNLIKADRDNFLRHADAGRVRVFVQR